MTPCSNVTFPTSRKATVSLGKSVTPPPKLNVKELAQLYKQRSLESKVRKGKMKSMNVQTMLVILGGMVYDSELNRGVRKKYLPEPNPQRVELPRDASLRAVFEKAKHLFFEDFEVELGAMCLADSGGVLLPIEDENNWSLSSFYTKNSLQPSRYKLYVVIGQEMKDKTGGSKAASSGIVESECVIMMCIECERPFRTYVPNTDCRLPDGGSVYYRDPQTMCPLCDPCGYGGFMNEDLFPELQADISAAANPADEDYRQL